MNCVFPLGNSLRRLSLFHHLPTPHSNTTLDGELWYGRRHYGTTYFTRCLLSGYDGGPYDRFMELT